MQAPLVLLIVGALMASQPGAHASDSSVVQRVTEEVNKFMSIMKTGAPDINIPVLDTLVKDIIPVHIDSDKIKASGSLIDLEISGLSTLTVTKLEPGSGGNKISLAVQIPSMSAITTYDLKGLINLGILKLPLEGSSQVSAIVSGLKAGADVDVNINSDDSLTIVDISNVDLGFSKAEINVSNWSKSVNKLLNKLIPSLFKSNSSKLVKLVESKGKEYINKYFSLTSGKKSVRLMHPLKFNARVMNGFTISDESRDIIEQIILELARSE